MKNKLVLINYLGLFFFEMRFNLYVFVLKIFYYCFCKNEVKYCYLIGICIFLYWFIYYILGENWVCEMLEVK